MVQTDFQKRQKFLIEVSKAANKSVVFIKPSEPLTVENLFIPECKRDLVSHIRHNRTNYHEGYGFCKVAQKIWKKRVIKAIGDKYPTLKGVCTVLIAEVESRP